jgi:hypothetical protein
VFCAFFRGLWGILLMWDKRVVNRMEVEVGDFVAACSFKNVDDGY